MSIIDMAVIGLPAIGFLAIALMGYVWSVFFNTSPSVLATAQTVLALVATIAVLHFAYGKSNIDLNVLFWLQIGAAVFIFFVIQPRVTRRLNRT